MIALATVELARCNGTVLVEHAGNLGIVERGGGWLGTAIFVAGLLTVIPAAAGIAFVTVDITVGAALIASAVLFAAITVLLVLRKRREARAISHPTPWLVFDLSARLIRDRQGATVGMLDQVRLERVMQAGSSSKALAVFCPAKIVIARGTPFGDDVDQLEHELRRRIGA